MALPRRATALVPALLVLTNVLGWSALLSSVAMPPMAVALMVASGAALRLATQIGVRWTLAIGIALTGVGLGLMALSVSVDGGYLSILGGLLALGFGSGLAMTPSTEAITSSLPREKQGVASALYDVTREFGTALGVALLGALLSAGYRSSLDGKLQGIPQGTADTARDGIANALEAAPSAGPRAQDLVHAARQSFVDGWQQAMWVGTAVMAALFVCIALRGPKNPAPMTADEAEVTENVAARRSR
ncbi:MFS transporter [Streptomyces sparsogenes]